MPSYADYEYPPPPTDDVPVHQTLTAESDDLMPSAAQPQPQSAYVVSAQAVLLEPAAYPHFSHPPNKRVRVFGRQGRPS